MLNLSYQPSSPQHSSLLLYLESIEADLALYNLSASGDIAFSGELKIRLPEEVQNSFCVLDGIPDSSTDNEDTDDKSKDSDAMSDLYNMMKKLADISANEEGKWL